VGAKAGQRGASRGRSDKSAGRQRLALIVFGALLVLLFVGFAVAQGIGSPSVPSGDVALVQDIPDEVGHISKETLDRAILQQAAEGKLKKTPEPGSDKYEELKEAALGEILERTWIFGEAEELGVSVTDKQVEDELATIKKSNFSAPGAYDKFLKESHFTQQDVNERVELQLLSTKVQEAVNAEAPPPSEGQIENYYNENKESQFTEEESRDVRVVINKDQSKVEAAKKALEADNSPDSWKVVAKKYSIDPTSKTKGGLQEGISEKLVKGPLKAAIFDTPTGQLAGPVQFEQNYILLEVVKLNPEKVKTLDEVKAQISSTLGQETQQEFFSEFVGEFRTKWEQRTVCADGYVIERCSNFVGDGRPANAPPACYEANPKTPATQCPAPVTPISPTLPGKVTPGKPKGEPFPQRPLPEAAAESGEEVPAGAVPGAAPEGEAPPAETGE
jgi:parvulin-like peptidyl-prolyl isomerase